MQGYDSICCFRSREESLGKRVCWEITTDCNLKCPFCHRSGFEPAYYDVRNLEATAGILRTAGIDNIILSGGEPLLHPQFYRILDYFSEQGFELDICSNGMLLNAGTIDRLKSRISEISISVDGFEKSRHDSMRQVPGSFDRLREVIPRLGEAGITVHTTTVVDAPFAGQIVGMTGFLHSLGVRSASYLGLIPIGTGRNDLFDPAVQELLERQIAFVRDRYPDMEINTKQLLSRSSGCKCEAGKIVFGMGIDGTVLHPCLLLRKRQGTDTGSTAGLCPGSRYLTQHRI